jgi:hypothetical protein
MAGLPDEHHRLFGAQRIAAPRTDGRRANDAFHRPEVYAQNPRSLRKFGCASRVLVSARASTLVEVPECFCGCGRRAGFRERIANLSGDETQQLLSRLEDALGRSYTDPSVGRLIEHGHVWRDVWAAVVHGEISGVAIDRASWTRWCEEAADLIRRTASSRPRQ